MDIKLLIFDLDGTIVDTVSSLHQAVNLTMDRYSFPHRTYEQVRADLGNGAVELIRRSIPQENGKDEAFLASAVEYYDKMYGKTYKNIDGCYAGMKQTIEELVRRGYVIAVLSNKQDHYVKKIVDILFDGDTVSFVAGQTALPRKPDPCVPIMIAEKFGVEPGECAIIGDSEVDILTARAAGMTAVACCWGYRDRQTLEDGDFLIDSPTQLLEIFTEV